MTGKSYHVYDISQEVFASEIYPGDPIPERHAICDMNAGDLYNATFFSMCAHNGTHIDAPRHFLRDGETVDEIPLEKTVGWCYVVEHEGEVDAEDAHAILTCAARYCTEASKKILIKGNAVVTAEAAEVLASAGCHLIGNESQSVGPVDAPMKVHLILLGAGVVLLEGIRLGEVEQGVYWLHAAPLNLGGTEGAPCRATLTKII